MTRRAVRTIASSDARFAVALSVQFVALVADAAVRIAVARLTLATAGRNVRQRIAVEAVIAPLATISAISLLAGALKLAAAAAAAAGDSVMRHYAARIGKVSFSGRASARTTRRHLWIAVITSGALVAAFARRVLAAVLLTGWKR